MNTDELAQIYRPRVALVTGGLGFIGSNLTRALVEFGCRRVIVIDSLDPDAGGHTDNLADVPGVEIHQGDIGDTDRVRPLVENVDVVFNLAGRTGHIASMRSPRGDLDANCAAQLGFLDACRSRGARLRIVFTSTRQVYGNPCRLPVDEAHPLDPPDVNAAHKLVAEAYHRIHARTTGAEVVCLRLTNVYGPRQSLSGASLGFFPTFVRKALRGEPIELFDGGNARRDLVFVEDAADALLRAGAYPNASGAVLNVGGEAGVTLREVASRLLALVGNGCTVDVPFPADRRAVDIGDFLTDARRIASELDWRASTPLDVGLERTLAFYRANPARFGG